MRHTDVSVAGALHTYFVVLNVDWLLFVSFPVIAGQHPIRECRRVPEVYERKRAASARREI